MTNCGSRKNLPLYIIRLSHPVGKEAWLHLNLHQFLSSLLSLTNLHIKCQVFLQKLPQEKMQSRNQVHSKCPMTRNKVLALKIALR